MTSGNDPVVGSRMTSSRPSVAFTIVAAAAFLTLLSFVVVVRIYVFFIYV